MFFSDPEKTIRSQGTTGKGISIVDDVWIGANAVLLDGITIGEGSVIGACSLVNRDVPANSIVAGNPATVKKYRGKNDLISTYDEASQLNAT